jgi:hypothetical protein
MIVRRIVRLSPEQRDAFDYTVFEPFAGVSDEPITQYFPYILRAYPNARVILSSRNATAWVNSRQKKHPMSPMPFSFLTRSIDAIYKLTSNDPQTDFSVSLNEFTTDAGTIAQTISKGEDPQDILWLRPNMANLGASTLALHLHDAVVRCLVPIEQLLEINLFEEDTDVVKENVAKFVAETLQLQSKHTKQKRLHQEPTSNGAT